jgi:hypothetical protein
MVVVVLVSATFESKVRRCRSSSKEKRRGEAKVVRKKKVVVNSGREGAADTCAGRANIDVESSGRSHLSSDRRRLHWRGEEKKLSLGGPSRSILI